MTHVRFAPEVPDELAPAVLWYEARRQVLGKEFLDEVQATLPLVDERPRSFPRLQDVDATLEIRRAFLARFPYALVSPPETRRETRAPERGDTCDLAGSGRRILVVDDNVDSAETLAMLLELRGSHVKVAHDGPTALQVARDSPPDVAFLDLGMPMMDGYELASRLRQLPALEGILLVALTGWGQEEDRRRSAEAGFDLHLVKPVEPSALQTVMAHPRLRRSRD